MGGDALSPAQDPRLAVVRRPAELERELAAAGLDVRDRVGLAPPNPLAAVRAMRARARGEITYAELGRRMRLRESRDTSGLYAGFAVKPPATLPPWW